MNIKELSEIEVGCRIKYNFLNRYSYKLNTDNEPYIDKTQLEFKDPLPQITYVKWINWNGDIGTHMTTRFKIEDFVVPLWILNDFWTIQSKDYQKSKTYNGNPDDVNSIMTISTYDKWSFVAKHETGIIWKFSISDPHMGNCIKLQNLFIDA